MKKLLSVILTIVMLVLPLAETAVLAAPSVVTTADAVGEVSQSVEEEKNHINHLIDISGYVNGNKSADYNEYTFSIQENGDVELLNHFTSKSEKTPVKDAIWLCIYKDRLFVLKQDGDNSVIFAYDVKQYIENVLCTINENIDMFSFIGNKIYYLCDGEIWSYDYKNNKYECIYSDSSVSSLYVYDNNTICFYDETNEHSHIDDSGKLLFLDSGEIVLKSEYLDSQITAGLMGAYGTDGSFSVKIGNQTIPFSDYPNGSYFTDNGKACSSHSSSCSYSSEAGCNCKLYYGSKNLLAIQCFGFARMVFYRLFGILGHPSESSKYTTVASAVSSGTVTVNYLKNLFNDEKAKPGAQIRTNSGSNGSAHSLIYMGHDDNYFYTYEGNYDGHCKVGVRKRTWSEAATYFSSTKYGINYVIMPKTYPGYSYTSAKQYKVSFDANGGTSAPASQAFSGTAFITLEVPVRENYTFLGWSTSTDDTVEHLSGAQLTLTADMTLYAVWKADSEIVAEKYFVYNNNKYEYYPISLPWNSAKAFCEKQGGYLVSITSDEEREALIENFGISSSYWLGASDAQQEGTWTWASGEAFEYTYWADGEPNNSEGREDYACIITGSPTAKWNDSRINLYVDGFICEYSDALYTITYSANGGSRTPASQTKTQGVDLTLTTSIPTRNGFEFQGWATSAKGSVEYAPGAIYTANSDITLYAIWKPNTFIISYDANGGKNAPESQTKTYALNLTLSSTIPTRDGYTFKGWSITLNGNVEYAPGATYTVNSAVTLYAVWEAETVPVTGVTLNKSSHTFEIGEILTLTSTVAPANATNKNITWKSSNTSVATVVNGVVTAVGEGRATITVTTEDGNKTATCAVTVTKKAEEPEFDENSPVIVVSQVNATQGKTVNVDISIKNNSGITSFLIYVEYDEQNLELTKITNGTVLANAQHKTDEQLTRNPVLINFADDLAVENNTSNGTVVTLTFKVADDAETGIAPISVTYNADDIYDIEMENVAFAVVNGGVEVSEFIVGDLNGDGLVNQKDRTTLARHLAGWTGYEKETFNYAAADVNGDGEVNQKDRTTLARHLAGWEGYEVLS